LSLQWYIVILLTWPLNFDLQSRNLLTSRQLSPWTVRHKLTMDLPRTPTSQANCSSHSLWDRHVFAGIVRAACKVSVISSAGWWIETRELCNVVEIEQCVRVQTNSLAVDGHLSGYCIINIIIRFKLVCCKAVCSLLISLRRILALQWIYWKLAGK